MSTWEENMAKIRRQENETRTSNLNRLCNSSVLRISNCKSTGVGGGGGGGEMPGYPLIYPLQKKSWKRKLRTLQNLKMVKRKVEFLAYSQRQNRES